MITEELAERDRRGRHRRGARPLAAHLRGAPRRLPGVLRPQPRHRRDGRHRRGGRHHRRAVDRRARHAADDADVPHRRRRRRMDITAGLPRVEELFEARDPQGQGRDQPHRRHRRDHPRRRPTKVKVVSHARSTTPRSALPEGAELLAAAGDLVELGQVLARSRRRPRRRHRAGRRASWSRTSEGLVVRAEDVVEREYLIPHNAKLLVENGQEIRAGDAITDGPINPQEYLDTRGKDAVQRYLVKEVQKVYKSQGVTINDKHIEIIVRQMLRKVRIDQPGDVELLPTELVDRLEFEEHNNRVLAEGGEPATAQTVLLGVTKASLNTSLVPRRGVLPGDDPGAHRGRHQRRQGPPDRAQGERHHRQAHPGRDGRAGRTSPPARSASARRPSRHSPARRSRVSASRSTTRSSRTATGRRPTTRPLASPWPRRSPVHGDDDDDVNPVRRRRRCRRPDEDDGGQPASSPSCGPGRGRHPADPSRKRPRRWAGGVSTLDTSRPC